MMVRGFSWGKFPFRTIDLISCLVCIYFLFAKYGKLFLLLSLLFLLGFPEYLSHKPVYAFKVTGVLDLPASHLFTRWKVVSSTGYYIDEVVEQL